MRSPWFNMKEAAEYLHLSQTKVRALVHENKIGHTRINSSNENSKIMFHQLWLDAYILGYGNALTPKEAERLHYLSEFDNLANVIREVVDVMSRVNKEALNGR